MMDKSTWMRPGLSENDNKYFRCLLHVAAKQSPNCLSGRQWPTKGSGGTGKCYNPYAVCHTTVSAGRPSCSTNYNFNNLPDQELQSYASLHNLGVPSPYNRQQSLNAIREYKTE